MLNGGCDAIGFSDVPHCMVLLSVFDNTRITYLTYILQYDFVYCLNTWYEHYLHKSACVHSNVSMPWQPWRWFINSGLERKLHGPVELIFLAILGLRKTDPVLIMLCFATFPVSYYKIWYHACVTDLGDGLNAPNSKMFYCIKCRHQGAFVKI